MEAITQKTRELWSSRTAFLLSAIGAAVGFGNVWRFPALAYEYGGGAFFLPYLLALFFIGIPFLVQEVAMGQHLRTSDVGVTNNISKHLRGVGVASLICGFVVVTYYVPLISWCLRALVESFFTDQWKGDSEVSSYDYFMQEIIGQMDDDIVRPTRILPANVLYLAITWTMVASCISFGIEWTGKIAYITMGLPILMLFILLVRSLTLPGAMNGLHEYIGTWDWSVLVEKPDVWSTAVSQIFFSIGVAFGIMTAFGSHCESNAPAFENSLVIAISNSVFSLISGISVFGILGYLAQDGQFSMASGPALLFGAYPAALATLSVHWVRFLFFNLILLGLDSAFALVEAVVNMLEDSSFLEHRPRYQIVMLVCAIGWFCGLVYTTDTAMMFVDVMDFYINFVLLGLGFCKSFAVGWVCKSDSTMETFGYELVYVYTLSTFGSLILASLAWFGVQGNTVLLGIVCWLVVYGMGLAYCWNKIKDMVLQSTDKSQSPRDLWFELSMGNILLLHAELQSSVGYIPMAWAICMKHFIPQVLLVLFFNLAFSRTPYDQWELGHYGDYVTWPFQVVGISVLLIVLGMVGMGLSNPDTLKGFVTNDKEIKHGQVAAEADGAGYQEMTTL